MSGLQRVSNIVLDQTTDDVNPHEVSHFILVSDSLTYYNLSGKKVTSSLFLVLMYRFHFCILRIVYKSTSKSGIRVSTLSNIIIS